jgi:ABC-2 type transport system permease protein
MRVVRPRAGIAARFAEVWRYRELLTGLVRKDLKVRYKSSALGFLWSFLNPMLYLVIFYVAFQVVLRAGIPLFPVWLLSGLLVWNLFSAGLTAATSSVTANAALVKKVAFPREILPLAAVGAALVHFFFQISVLALALLAFRHSVEVAYLPLLPLGLAAVVLLAAGLGLLLSSINVRLRDTEHFVELALLAWFWFTPIIYPYMTVGSRADTGQRWLVVLYTLNPVTPVVVTFQRTLYNRLEAPGRTGGRLGELGDPTALLPHWDVWAYAGMLTAIAVVGLGLVAAGMWVFGRLQGDFAEEL